MLLGGTFTQNDLLNWNKAGQKLAHWDPKRSDVALMDLKIYSSYQWIGLRENLQENPIFNGKIYGFL